jgi:hypothetical protein
MYAHRSDCVAVTALLVLDCNYTTTHSESMETK